MIDKKSIQPENNRVIVTDQDYSKINSYNRIHNQTLDPKKTWVLGLDQNPSPKPKFFLGLTNLEFNSKNSGVEIKRKKNL